MTGTSSLHGIFVPLITPFTACGRVAEDALAGLAREVLAAGAAGIVALGTTAEAATLSPAEKRTVTGVCAAVCAERGAALVAGAGSSDTRASAAALASLAQWPEITGALVPVPAYSRPGEAGVVAHFTRLAAASPVPLVVYHVPGRTAQPLGAGALAKLARLPNVAGIKLATGSLDADAVRLLADSPPGFAVLAGDDVLLSPMLALGAAGGILASAHLATGSFAALAAAWADGDLASARALGPALARLSAAAFAGPTPVVVKGALHALGRIPTPDVRLPLLPAAPAQVTALLTQLTALDPTASQPSSPPSRPAGNAARSRPPASSRAGRGTSAQAGFPADNVHG
jgi:4-hydroxy-tetrahydrodipicolinate synthase